MHCYLSQHKGCASVFWIMLSAMPQQFRSLLRLHWISQECRSCGWEGERVEERGYSFICPLQIICLFNNFAKVLLQNCHLSSQSLLAPWPFFSRYLNLWMHFTDNIIFTGKGSVRSEIIQQPETLTAICLCVCQSVWCFYAFLIFSLSLFERHTDKELTMSARRESAK